MDAIKLELRCPPNVNGIAADPQPDWSFDGLLLELSSIEKSFIVTVDMPGHFAKKQTRELLPSKENYESTTGFMVHVSDDEMHDADTDGESSDENVSIVPGRRFACDELYMSDDSEDGAVIGIEGNLMDKVGLSECALSELTHDYQLSISEEVRNKISALEADLVDENEKFVSLIAKVEKGRELQEEKERRFDLQFRRTIAEALDSHITAVQRDHAHISQLEERRIRDDAAREEAKRKEKALQEEKLRQERAKAKEEERLKAERAEMAKAAAIKAEKQAEEEAAAKHTSETVKDIAQKALDNSKETLQLSVDPTKAKVQFSGKNVIRASKNALELEKKRRQAYEELSAKNEVLKASTHKHYNRLGQNISRRIKTISATVENIKTRADELLQLINSSECPHSLSIALFAEKVVSNCANQRSSNAIFAIARVIVLVTSKVRLAMDILLAELNRVCIYTVPKHISYSEAAFTTKDAYYKTIGYVEEDGKFESTDDFLEKLSSYMKLYGAIVQTEVGVQNLHGLGEGWAWLARFLNSLPANLYTAVALQSFLEMAGFALYRRYKNQFEKLLKIIAHDFLNALKEGSSEAWNAKLKKTKMSILNYIEANQFKKEPEGLQLRGHLESNDFY